MSLLPFEESLGAAGPDFSGQEEDDSIAATDIAENISDLDSVGSDENISLGGPTDDFADSEADTLLKYCCPIHKSLYHGLKSSSYLSPIHIRVKNESYWYHMRKKLGPKKQNSIIAKQNPNN